MELDVGRKNVLMLSPGFPYPVRSGGQARVYNLIKEVSKHHDVTFLSFVVENDMPFIKHMEQFCKSVETVRVDVYDDRLRRYAAAFGPRHIYRTASRLGQWTRGMPFQMCRFHDPRMCRKLRRLVSGGSFDVVHSTYAQLGPYLSMAKRTDPTVATVLTDIDLVFVTMEREESTRKGPAKLLFASDRKRVSSYVAREWTSFSKIIAMSDVDRQKLLAVQPDLDVAVVPNGVDTAYFAPVGERRADSVKLMFLGGSQHSPNVDA
ncbi:MAG: glycosyltransferase, partial [Candidatus Hydrogenedentes bacterium]|nr:glycosyltransferase [Candidatus Hydrogenedentota bacterium]